MISGKGGEKDLIIYAGTTKHTKRATTRGFVGNCWGKKRRGGGRPSNRQTRIRNKITGNTLGGGSLTLNLAKVQGRYKRKKEEKKTTKKNEKGKGGRCVWSS